MRLSIGLLASLVLSLPAQAGESAGIIFHEAITYKVVDGRELKLDLAQPEGKGPFPAVVFLHGGGWIAGNRSRYWFEVEEAARRGFVGATITYRLSRGGVEQSADGFPAALQDAKAAIRFLRRNADRYDVDSDRIGVVGESAGGHLALLAGLTRPEDGLDGGAPPGAPSSAVQAVVNVFGATDLPALVKENRSVRPVLLVLLGGSPEQVPQRYVEASPIRYVRKGGPPILTIHGSADRLVPVSQARRFDAAMKRAGGKHELIVFYGAGHGFRGEHYRRCVTRIFEFLSRTLQPGS